ncbi:MAG TPA: lipopolysaccharide biosynthesis protein [Gaiellaceae bacterium]|nr:lipopolysaccharide biosynthesis protein [Gaiellaceae bacterium]
MSTPGDTPQGPAKPDGPEEVLTGKALDRKVIQNSGWTALIYGSRSMVLMLSTLVLVRLLQPHEFGITAVAMMLIGVAQQLQAAGMTAAIIYKRENIREAAASAILFTGTGGFLLAGVAAVIAPYFTHIIGAPEATDVVRVMAILLALRGLAAVPGAILERSLDYGSRAKADIGSILVQFAVAIGTAAVGFGVWSLVAGSLAGTLTQTITYWVLIPWRPNPREGNLKTLRELIRYGRFITINNLALLFSNTAQTAAVTRILGTTALGYYNVTFRLANLPTTLVGVAVGRSMFPAYSMVQNNLAEFRRIFLQMLQRTALLVVPLAVLLAIGAEPIVRALLGEKWLPVIWPLRIVAAFSVIRAFGASAGAVFQAAGKPHLAAWYALPQAITIVPLLIVLTKWLGVSGAALGMLLSFAVSGMPAFVQALRLLEITPRMLTRSLTPSLACSGILAVVLLALVPTSLEIPPLAGFAVVAVGAAVTYAIAAVTIARSAVRPIWRSLRGSPA